MSEAAFGPPRFVLREPRTRFASAARFFASVRIPAQAAILRRGRYVYPAPRRRRGPARASIDARVRAARPAGSPSHTQNSKREHDFGSRSASRSCWRPASTSATRRAAGTPRCAASSSASAAASTSSTCRRPSGCCAHAQEFAGELAGRGGTILFVGTKKQARDTIEEAAEACGHAVRQPALAGRPADQLPDDLQAHQAPARAARLDRERHARPAADARAHRGDEGARQARDQPRRRARHAAPARRDVRRRPQDRGDRRARGRAPEDPDHRPGGHQLRPGPGDLRDPRQRRRDPLLQARHRGDRRRGGRALGAASAPRRRPPAASARSRSAARPRSGARARPRRRSARRPRSARAARPRRPASRRTSPPRPAAPGAAGGRRRAARRASAGRFDPDEEPEHE